MGHQLLRDFWLAANLDSSSLHQNYEVFCAFQELDFRKVAIG